MYTIFAPVNAPTLAFYKNPFPLDSDCLFLPLPLKEVAFGTGLTQGLCITVVLLTPGFFNQVKSKPSALKVIFESHIWHMNDETLPFVFLSRKRIY